MLIILCVHLFSICWDFRFCWVASSLSPSLSFCFSDIFICFHSGFGWDLPNARTFCSKSLYVVFIWEIFTCTFRFQFRFSMWKIHMPHVGLSLCNVLSNEYCNNNSKSLIGYSRIMDWLFGIESALVYQLQIPKITFQFA